MNKKKKKKQIKVDPRDQRAERIIYASIMIVASIFIIGLYLLSQEFV